MKNVKKIVSLTFITIEVNIIKCLVLSFRLTSIRMFAEGKNKYSYFYLQSRPADRSPISFLVFSTDPAAQSYSIKITSVFGQLVVLVKVWLNHVQKSPSSVKTDEELKQEVKNLGGYLQLLLQVKYIFWKKKI